MWQDVRYSMRILMKNPVLTAVGLLVLALAIGVNTAIYSIINAVLFQPLPVHAPDELLYIHSHNPKYADIMDSIAYEGDYLYLRQNNAAFTDILARYGFYARLSVNGEVEQINCEAVSANYFGVLGVKPLLGRTFLPEDDLAPGGQAVVVISHSLWKGSFNADPDILGKSIRMKDINPSASTKSFTITGVAGPQFRGISSPWSATQIWVPIVQWCAVNVAEDPRIPFYNIHYVGVRAVARLKPGVTREQARAAVSAIGKYLGQANHANVEGWSLLLLNSRKISLPFDPSGRVIPERLAAALMAVTGMVLVIAAANLAGILMARGIMRQGEIGIRLALGGSRVRIMRQLLTESLVLSVAGGVLGMLLARSFVRLFLSNTPAQFFMRQFSLEVPLDLRVFLFTALLCIGAGVLVGLAPAYQASRTELLRVLSHGGGVAPRHVRMRLRHWIVIPQICLSLVLLLVAGLMVRTLLKDEMADPGYNPQQLVFVQFEYARPHDLPLEEQKKLAEKRKVACRHVLERVRSLPDISSAALALSLPLDKINTWVMSRGTHRYVSMTGVSPGYFRTMGIPMLLGRDFEVRDDASALGVVIVCDALARQLWPGKNPIGERLAFQEPGSARTPQWLEVVGVVKEVKRPLTEGGPNPLVYCPAEQRWYARTVVARGYGNPAQLVKKLVRAVQEADPNLEIYRSTTVKGAIDEVLYPRRMAAAILAISALIGLLLSSVGIYGVVSYSVAQRIREIGIRAALGARKEDIIRLVIGEGFKVAAIGSCLGLVLTLAAAKIASRYIVALPAGDATTFIAMPVLITAVIVAASYFPARRAARVDPMVALREL
jgi:putative ABC transport system permease protein